MCLLSWTGSFDHKGKSIKKILTHTSLYRLNFLNPNAQKTSLFLCLSTCCAFFSLCLTSRCALPAASSVFASNAKCLDIAVAVNKQNFKEMIDENAHSKASIK